MTPHSTSGPGRGPGRGAAPRRQSGKAAPSPKPAARRPAAPPPPAAKRPQAPKKPAAKKPAPKKSVSANRSTGLLPQYAPARTRPVVSKTSAQRFAAKVRARRRKRALTAVVVVLVMATGSWIAVFSPWATVNRVTISGLDRVPEDQVRGATDAELGHSLLLARTTDLATQLEKLRLVKSVQVSRSWPGTLKVAVTEREPVAALPSGAMAGNTTTAGSGTAKGTTPMVQLVDDEGVVIETVTARSAPRALPRIEVVLGQRQSVANLRGTLAVLNGLPDNLRSRLKAIGTRSPDGIWLKLSAPLKSAKKRTVLVQWGDAEQGRVKAKVLTALLKHRAQTYDVRAPEMPSTTS